MKISTLDTMLQATVGPVAPTLVNQSAVRSNIFRILLSGVAKPGARLVDLAAGPCLFAMTARDEGFAVTAVDGRVERKPPDDELGSIRFVQSDIRNFDLAGFDVIVCLGMLYHFDLEDQIRFLERCAQSGAPMILETQVHVDALVPDEQTGAWARKIVRRGKYEGVVYREQDNPMASIGNPESFWCTELSLMQMFEDVGFKDAAVIDPIYQSKYGARRYFLLNCEDFVANPDVVADVAQSVERVKFATLINRGRFDEGRAMWERLPPLPEGVEDWSYKGAVVKMQLHFGETEKAVQALKQLRERAMSGGGRWSAALLRLAQFFETAGDHDEAERTRAAAYGSIRNPTQIKSLIKASTASGQDDNTRKLAAIVEERFADNADLLGICANAYSSMKDYESAARVCRIALVLSPQSAKLQARLGNLLLHQNDNEGAAAALESALALDKGNPEILEKLTTIYLQLKNSNRAENFANKLLRLAPLNAKAHYLLARSLRGRNRGAEELEHAQRAAELDPGNARYREYIEMFLKPRKKAAVKPE